MNRCTDVLRGLDTWLPGYLRSLIRRAGRHRAQSAEPRHLLFCIADHFEPFAGGRSRDDALRTVRHWVETYPRAFADLKDADGRCPCHTFFYPAEEYDPECLDGLRHLQRAGFAEVEVHLHHRNDTPEGLRSKLMGFVGQLRERHGLLGAGLDGKPRYGFIHGNWALCNSRPDGDWCGVNEELGILSATGCYADFTFPSAPSPTQPRTVNAIYRARDVPGRPRSHDRGVPVRAGAEALPLSSSLAPPLMLIQGPLALNWQRRKWGLFPRIDNGEISAANPPTLLRARLWVSQGIGVSGRPEWVFVKVHTHGAVPGNARVLLDGSLRQVCQDLQSEFNSGYRWRLHYVSARETYNIVRAAEAGMHGNPGQYRDYEVLPPPGCP